MCSWDSSHPPRRVGGWYPLVVGVGSVFLLDGAVGGTAWDALCAGAVHCGSPFDERGPDVLRRGKVGSGRTTVGITLTTGGLPLLICEDPSSADGDSSESISDGLFVWSCLAFSRLLCRYSYSAAASALVRSRFMYTLFFVYSEFEFRRDLAFHKMYWAWASVCRTTRSGLIRFGFLFLDPFWSRGINLRQRTGSGIGLRSKWEAYKSLNRSLSPIVDDGLKPEITRFLCLCFLLRRSPCTAFITELLIAFIWLSHLLSETEALGGHLVVMICWFL